MEGFNWLTGFVFPYVNLAIFLFLFVKLFKDPLKTSFSGKKADFVKALEEANSAKEEAMAKQKELNDRLAALDSELEGMRSRAKAQAEDEARRIVEHASSLADNLKKEAERIAQTEVANARREMREDIIESVRKQVAARLKTELDGAKHLEVVRKQLTQIPQRAEA